MVDQTHLLFGEIDIDKAKDVADWIISNNSAKKYPFLVLIINSEGGDLAHGLSIIDMMNYSKIPVHTFGTGEIISSGLMIFMNGLKGCRTLTPNVSILSHRFSGGSDGKYHDLQAMSKEYKMLNERMLNHYIRCTGLSKSKVNSKLLSPTDVWLSPQEAIELGLADSISN